MSEEHRFQVFLVVWIILGVSQWWAFHRDRDVAMKRKMAHINAWLLPILFCAFVPWLTQSWQPLVLIIPFCIIGIWWSLKRLPELFCESCGSLIKRAPFSVVKFCGKCGAEIPTQKQK